MLALAGIELEVTPHATRATATGSFCFTVPKRSTQPAPIEATA
jgi:hypothetical protein